MPSDLNPEGSEAVEAFSYPSPGESAGFDAQVAALAEALRLADEGELAFGNRHEWCAALLAALPEGWHLVNTTPSDLDSRDRLRVELLAMEAWYGPEFRPMVGASVYMGSDGRFSGGVWIDADSLSRDEWGDDPLVEDGDSPAQVIDGLIAAMRQYRADRDRERAEMAAEDSLTAALEGVKKK